MTTQVHMVVDEREIVENHQLLLADDPDATAEWLPTLPPASEYGVDEQLDVATRRRRIAETVVARYVAGEVACGHPVVEEAQRRLVEALVISGSIGVQRHRKVLSEPRAVPVAPGVRKAGK